MEPDPTALGESAMLPKGESPGCLRQDRRYRRLAVGGRTATGRSSYWLSEDHLLVVETEHFAESYKRFYFREIQAVLVRRTRAWEWGMALGLVGVGLLAFVALLQAYQSSGSAGAGSMIVTTIFGVLALGLLAGVIVHGALGPSCVVSIFTGVQSRRLAGVGRWRQAARVLALLEPEILAAQQPMPGRESGTTAAQVAAEEGVESRLAEDHHGPGATVQ